jgi:hypothetical protein
MIKEALLYYAIRSGIALWHKTRYYTLHIFLLYKSKKTIQMFFGKFADEGDNTVNDPSIYYVDGTNMLSPSLQPPTTGSVLKICVFFSPVP